MKNSIRIKLFLSIIGIVILGNIVGFLINNTLYGELFLNSQKDSLLKSAIEIENFLLQNDEEKMQDLIESISENNGYIVYVLGFEDMMSSRGNRQGAIEHLNIPLVTKQLREMGTDSYDYAITFNEKYESNFLKIVYLSGDTLIVIETPTRLLNNSKDVNSKLFLIVTAVSVFITIIFSYIFAMRFTKPILKISNQAKNISNLEFEDEYMCKEDGDEIDLLGENMNFLSNKLELTISELNKEIGKLENMEISRKELIANVSHELKTPIALIKGYAEGLKYKLNEVEDEYEDIIISEADKMNSLVKELLNLSDIEAGHIMLYFQEFDLSSLVDEIFFKYSIIFKERGIKVNVFKEDIIDVNGDMLKIEEVITNFLNNALSHIDDNKIIEVNLTRMSNGKVKFELFNTGEIISEKDREEIWTSFYRVDKSRNREGNRAGLGLYIVKTIIEKHNGSCGVENKDNGVNFYFEM